MSAQPNNRTGPSGAGANPAQYRPYRPGGENDPPAQTPTPAPAPASPPPQKQFMPYRPTAGSPAPSSPATPGQFRPYRPGGATPPPAGGSLPPAAQTQNAPPRPEKIELPDEVQTPPPVPGKHELPPVVQTQETASHAEQAEQAEARSLPPASPAQGVAPSAQDPAPPAQDARSEKQAMAAAAAAQDAAPSPQYTAPAFQDARSEKQALAAALAAAAAAEASVGSSSNQDVGAEDLPPAYEEHSFPPPPPGPPRSSSTQSQGDYPPPPPGPPPSSDTKKRADYPPPPPGPPPATSTPIQQDQYPPPPPGPPPGRQDNQKHPLQSHPVESQPTDEPLPGYTETPGLHFPVDQKVHPLPVDPKAPPLPPRRDTSQAEAYYFSAPPGTEDGAGPSNAAAGPSNAAAGPSGTQATSPAPSVASGDSKDSKKGKKTFGERFYGWSVKAGVPINKITNKLGSEAFWPMSMDKECDKAARILKSFCKDGFYTDASSANNPAPSPGHSKHPGPNPNPKSKTLVKIPQQALQQAHGLAIFTVFRTGLHISGASGSGLIVSRLPDGSWSPPSGLLVHTLGAGFMVGLDIYDCVCVLRTPEAVKAFASRPRLSLGGEISVVAGPVGGGTSLEAALGAGKPVWSYMKSRGLYAGVAADGTVIVSRPDANAVFYGEKGITPDRILRGEVKEAPPVDAAASLAGALATDKKGDSVVMWPQGARQLMEVLKSAEGKRADERIVEEVGKGPTPGDLASTEGVRWEGGGKDVKESMRYA